MFIITTSLIHSKVDYCNSLYLNLPLTWLMYFISLSFHLYQPLSSYFICITAYVSTVSENKPTSISIWLVGFCRHFESPHSIHTSSLSIVHFVFVNNHIILHHHHERQLLLLFYYAAYRRTFNHPLAHRYEQVKELTRLGIRTKQTDGGRPPLIMIIC